MQPNKHERREKRYLKLIAESNSLYKQRRSMPWIEVKPYQDGWTLHMDFRDDIKRRVDYPTLQRVLELISISGTTRNPKAVSRVRSDRRPDAVYLLFNPPKAYARNIHHQEGDVFGENEERYYRRSSSYGSAPVLGRLSVKNWEKENADVQKWFYKVEDDTKYWGLKEWYQANFPRYWMVVRVKPAIVTHHRAIDPVLQRKEAEVDAEIELLRNMGYSNSNYKYRYFAKEAHKALRAAERGIIQKLKKGEIEDFEIKKKIRFND